MTKLLYFSLCAMSSAEFLTRLFPNVLSYNRFVELQEIAVVKLVVFVNTVQMGKYTVISFIEDIYGKLMGDRGYICKELFCRLFVDGIQLITKLKNRMKNSLMSVSDKMLSRKLNVEDLSDFI